MSPLSYWFNDFQRGRMSEYGIMSPENGDHVSSVTKIRKFLSREIMFRIRRRLSCLPYQ